MPACLPEQLLCSAVGSSPERSRACADSASNGRCAPHWRSSTPHPMRSSSAETRSTCTRSPLWDEAVRAMSSAEKPNRSVAPLATTAIVWNGLADERQ